MDCTKWLFAILGLLLANQIVYAKRRCSDERKIRRLFDKCSHGQHICKFDGKTGPFGITCIPYTLLCDGHTQCPQGDDEQNCQCPPLPTLEYGSFMLEQHSSWKFGDKANVKCWEGYEVTDKRATEITCRPKLKPLDIYHTHGDICVPKVCDVKKLPYDQYGNYEVLESAKYGSLAVLKCHNRIYKQQNGNLANVKCGSDGQWTTPTVFCGNDCGNLPQVQHGSYQRENYSTNSSYSYGSYGLRAKLVCNEGYKLVGNEYIKCDQYHGWKDVTGTCQFKGCGTPVVENGTYTIVGDGKEAVLKCDTHFKLVGAVHPVIIKCVDGTWTKPSGTCSQECPEGFLLHKDRCFFVSKMSKTWDEANDQCEASGGHLANIDSADLQTLLDDYIKAAQTAESTNVVVYTPNEETYKFLDEFGFSLSGETGFVFELKANNDGHISLNFDMIDPKLTTSIMDEIVIAGFHGLQSIFRTCWQCFCSANCANSQVIFVHPSTPLDTTAFKKFWVSWSGGVVKFGPGHNIGEDQFTEWTRDDDHAVNHIAILTAFGSDGVWKFPVKCFMPGEFWLGAQRTSPDTFSWLPSQTPLVYTNWDTATQQPDDQGDIQDCMFLNRDMKWMDGFCREKRNYICEKPISG